MNGALFGGPGNHSKTSQNHAKHSKPFKNKQKASQTTNQTNKKGKVTFHRNFYNEIGFLGEMTAESSKILISAAVASPFANDPKNLTILSLLVACRAGNNFYSWI